MKKRIPNLKVIFYRYQGNTLAINHFQDADPVEASIALPILPCHLCFQYAEYPDIMNAASHDLRDKKDGKWIFDGEYGWQCQLMEPFEEMACKQAVKYYRKPATDLRR